MRRAQNNEIRYFSWRIDSTCNYNCSYCLYEKKIIKENFNFEIFIKKFSKNLPGIWVVEICGVGEPFLIKNFFKIIKRLVFLGYKIAVISNFSASIEDIGKFIKIAGNNIYKFSGSLHLEKANVEDFLDKARFVNSLIGSRFCVLSIARKGQVEKLEEIRRQFRKNGIFFAMQLEKIDSVKHDVQFVKYSKKEIAIIEKSRRSISYSKKCYYNKGKSCVAGKNYFVLNKDGDAYQCDTARFQGDKNGYLGNFLRDDFSLNKKNKICKYEFCRCATPIKLNADL